MPSEPGIGSRTLPGWKEPRLLCLPQSGSHPSSSHPAVLDFAPCPFLAVSCRRKAAGLRRRGKVYQPGVSAESWRVSSLSPHLLDRCFLPARWVVSMARVSSTGRWGQMAQAKLRERRRCLGREGGFLLWDPLCLSNPCKAQLRGLSTSTTLLLKQSLMPLSASDHRASGLTRSPSPSIP